jgi:S1-C subfamily serine protease
MSAFGAERPAVRVGCTRRALLALPAWAALAATGAAVAADLPSLVAKARPSVLAVGSYSALQTPRFGFRGSGFVVGNGNRLVTNAHVLPERGEGEAEAPRTVVLIPGRAGAEPQMRAATVVEVDRAHDLALLEFEGPALAPLALAPNDPVAEGTDVVLIGFPIGGILGYTPVTHRGIVASVTAVAPPPPSARQLAPQAVHRMRQGSFDIYQLDAVAYPGNSGGPLIDVQSGQVVGVINMVLVKGARESALSQPTGITYAIPVRFVDALLKQRR